MAADVPARRAEPRIAQDAHELGPQADHGDGAQWRAGRAIGVHVTRHVGHHPIERVGWGGAIGDSAPSGGLAQGIRMT